MLGELRSRARRRQLAVLADRMQMEMVDVPLERGGMAVAIWQAIEELPVDLRVALLLRDVLGLSYAEIGDVLGVSLSTVRRRVFASRERVLLALRLDLVRGEPTAVGARPA